MKRALQTLAIAGGLFLTFIYGTSIAAAGKRTKPINLRR